MLGYGFEMVHGFAGSGFVATNATLPADVVACMIQGCIVRQVSRQANILAVYKGDCILCDGQRCRHEVSISLCTNQIAPGRCKVRS